MGALLSEERVWHLNQDARAVPGLRVSATSAPVPQIDEDLKRFGDYLMGLLTFDIGDESHTTAIVLQVRSIQSVLG